MSADHPQTLEEWRNFRFPVRDRSTLDEAARAVASANGEGTDEDQGKEGAEGKGGGGGTGGIHLDPPLPVALVESHDGTAPHPPVAVVAPSPPVDPPPAKKTVVAKDQPSIAVPVPPVPAPDEVSPSVVTPGAGDSWTYDAPRALLINWRIEKAMALNKMDTVARIRAFIGEVAKNNIDRWGFESALDEACKDVHKVSLAEILDTWPNDAKMRWSAPPEKNLLPTSRPRRRPASR